MWPWSDGELQSRDSGGLTPVVNSVLVLGGGSGGLLTAVTLKRRLPALDVTVVRSPEIGVIGVGEGTTVGVTRHLHGTLGLDPNPFQPRGRADLEAGAAVPVGPAAVVRLRLRAGAGRAVRRPAQAGRALRRRGHDGLQPAVGHDGPGAGVRTRGGRPAGDRRRVRLPPGERHVRRRLAGADGRAVRRPRGRRHRGRRAAGRGRAWPGWPWTAGGRSRPTCTSTPAGSGRS